MRNLTTSARSKSLTAKGTFPIVILEIQWASGTVYYTELEYTFQSRVCDPALMTIGAFASSGKIGSKGEVSTIDFTLDDSTSNLKQKINRELIEGRPARVWHHFYDLPSSDATLIFQGVLAGPIKWNEGERTFSASVESLQNKGETNFIPSDISTNPNYVDGLLPEAYNTVWPIVFGNPKRIPVSQVYGPTEEDPDAAAVYIVQSYATASVSKVLAKRRCYGGKEDDLYVVSPTLYSVQNTTIGGKTVTTVTFPSLLSTRENEGWSDDIFVDVSGLSSNIADIINWLLTTFTTLTTDSSSFNAAAALIASTPANFVLQTQQDALRICEELAWQARCLLFIKNNIAYLRPLFVNDVSDAVITLNEARLRGVSLGFTETEDIITVFNAKWKKDYSGHKESDQVTVVKNNVNLYGTIPKDYDFFAFTSLRSVQIASLFWAYRYANSWRRITAECFLPTLKIEAFDCVQFAHPTLSTFSIRGFAESVKHDTENVIIELEAELGSKAGDHSGGQPIEDPKYWTGGDGKKDGYNSPVAARLEKTICKPEFEKEAQDDLDNNSGGYRIKVEAGSIGPHNAYEIYWVERDVYISEDKARRDVYHVGTPREDNLESGQILFTKETVVGAYGWGFPAGEEVWVDYNLNPDEHPNYFSSPATKIGDNVGTKSGSQQLSKDRHGFVVTGLAGGKITVAAGSVDPKLEPVKSTDPIGAFDPGEIYGYDGEHILIRKPTEDNLPPGRIIFPVTPLSAGGKGKGYNAFDISAYVTGSEPSAPGAEFGTQAGSYELVEGNSGFVSLGRKGTRNQYRPF
jgi:hypothetical protein